MSFCPCCSEKNFTECCGPILEGSQKAQSAEELLRSRYTAFTKANIDYIRKTRHPRSNTPFDEQSVRQWAENSNWLGLKILNQKESGKNNETVHIEFIATFSQKNKEQEHHELSTFVKEDDTWYFVDGDHVVPDTFRREAVKVGRNDPCPCKSGKKFKKCCGR